MMIKKENVLFGVITILAALIIVGISINSNEALIGFALFLAMLIFGP